MTALVTAEIRKLTTLKFWWALALPPVLVGICASAISSAVATSAEELTGGEIDEVATAGLFVAIGFAVLFAAVFSAVNAGTEFRHDTVTTSFLTSSSRDRVIGAKIAVTALFALGYGIVVVVSSVVCLLLFTAGRFELSGNAAAFAGAGLFAVVLWSLIGSGLGLLFGSPTWSAIVIIAWFPVGESITLGILSGLGLEGAWYVTPASLTMSVVGAGRLNETGAFATWPWAPIGLMLWAGAAVALGWLRTRERDIA